MILPSIAALLLQVALVCHAAIQEKLEALGCSGEMLELRCSQTKNPLAIYSAQFRTYPGSGAGAFYPGPGPGRCFPQLATANYSLDELQKDTDAAPCSEDMRLHVNDRCSGRNNCQFNVSNLFPRQCYGDGVLRIIYGCALDSSLIQHCNENVSGNTAEGYIVNPGYPAYYPGPLDCVWYIRGDPGQTVLLTVIDLALQSSQGTASDCPDYFQIFDGAVKVLHACGQSLSHLKTRITQSNVVKLRFISRDMWPKRGVFIYYRVQGCATPDPPYHGYLVTRNESHAHYMCCAKHAFIDTYKRHRFLFCQDGNRWNGTVSACKSVQALKKWRNYTGAEIEEEYPAEPFYPVQRLAAPVSGDYMMADILIPSAVMATMVVSNVVIVLIILRMRRRQKQKREVESRTPVATHQATQINGIETERMVTSV